MEATKMEATKMEATTGDDDDNNNSSGSDCGDEDSERVRSHQDNIKLWHQLTLLQQLNCICDTLAKSAATKSLTPLARRRHMQVLFTESVAVFVGGIKQISNVAPTV